MKMRELVLVLAPLMILGCGDQADKPVAEPTAGGGTETSMEETSGERLKREAGEWTKETKELGQAAWDATKEKTAEYADKTGEYYDQAKQKSQEYYEQAKDKSAEYYEQAKTTSAEYYEVAKEKGKEVYEGAKADMEAREGHPPEMETTVPGQ